MGYNTASILLLVAFIALIYFMMIRPQRKKEKADREMRDSLRVGDEIMTIGGIIGKITKINEKSVIITTGADKTKIEFVKSAISSVSRPANAPTARKIENTDDDSSIEEKSPSKDKKVAPKKLSRKSDENQ